MAFDDGVPKHTACFCVFWIYNGALSDENPVASQRNRTNWEQQKEPFARWKWPFLWQVGSNVGRKGKGGMCAVQIQVIRIFDAPIFGL